MNIIEKHLPGIGMKYRIHTINGDKLVIILYENGRRELYHFDPHDQDTSISMVALNTDEAQAVAKIVGGHTYQPKPIDSIDITLDGLVIEWYKIHSTAKCIGKTIGELDIRKHTGATILAVIESGTQRHINPGADYVLKPNSTLVVAGDHNQIQALKELIYDGRIAAS